MQLRPAAMSTAILALALAGCGSGDPATPATATASSRSALDLTVVPTTDQYKFLVHQIYVAYFGRPADIAGRDYWVKVLSDRMAPPDLPAVIQSFGSDGRTRPIIDAFASSQEWHERYPGTNPEFVDKLYRNLFKHPADAAGLTYWTNALNSGQMTRQVAALMLMAGAQGDDALAVNKKVTVARRFDELLSARISAEQVLLGYPVESLRSMISLVDAKTDLVAFDATIKAAVEAVLNGCPGQTVAGAAQSIAPCPV